MESSIQPGVLVVTEVDESLLHKFKTEEDKNKFMVTLEHWKIEEHNVKKED